MKDFRKIDRINEHHGEDWDPALLDMSLNTFLDKVKEADPEAYSAMEKIIDSVSGKISGDEFDNDEYRKDVMSPEEHDEEYEKTLDNKEDSEIPEFGKEETPDFLKGFE